MTMPTCIKILNYIEGIRKRGESKKYVKDLLYNSDWRHDDIKRAIKLARSITVKIEVKSKQLCFDFAKYPIKFERLM